MEVKDLELILNRKFTEKEAKLVADTMFALEDKIAELTDERNKRYMMLQDNCPHLVYENYWYDEGAGTWVGNCVVCGQDNYCDELPVGAKIKNGP